LTIGVRRDLTTLAVGRSAPFSSSFHDLNNLTDQSKVSGKSPSFVLRSTYCVLRIHSLRNTQYAIRNTLDIYIRHFAHNHTADNGRYECPDRHAEHPPGLEQVAHVLGADNE